MQKVIRNSTGRVQNDSGRIASFADVRTSAPTVEPAPPNGIDIAAAVAKRPLLAAIPLLLAMVLGVVYAVRYATREYRAESTVYVSPTYFKNLEGDREQLQITYTTLVNQQILTIRREDVLSEAINRLELQGIHWRNPQETEASAIARLSQQLDVKYIPESYEVLVALNDNRREWVAPVVNTVVNTYLDKQKLEDLVGRSGRVEALNAEQAEIAAQLQKKLAEQAALSGPLMVANVDKAVPADDSLIAATRQARDDARRKRVEAETQISILENSKNTEASKSALSAYAEDAAAKDPNLRAQMGNLQQRSLELNKRIEGLTAKHPQRIAIEKELAAINEQLTAIPRKYRDEVSERLLAKLHGEADQASLLEKELDKEVQLAASGVQTKARQIQQAQGLSAEIERLRKTQASLASGLDDAATSGGTPGYLRVFSPAQTPAEAYKTHTQKAFAGLLLMALVLGIGLCVIMDLVDQRILSPLDVKRAVGFPPVGIILEKSAENTAFAEDQFNRMINGIARGLAVEGAKSVVLTPLKLARTPAGLVNDIGRALAARGLKAIVIDANPQIPQQPQLSGAKSKPQQLSGRTETNRMDDAADEAAALALGSPDLAIADIEIRSPRELRHVEVDRPVGEMLASFKHDYDVVLIDAPPLRFSADTEFLSAIAEITLVVVETGEATRRELSRGAVVLSRIGTQSMGVIMNQVRLRKAGAALSHDFKEFTARPLTAA